MFFSLIKSSEQRGAHGISELVKAGPYADHQWLWRFFPGDSQAKRDFLFRRELFDGGIKYYVVSAREPQAPDGSQWVVAGCRPYKPSLNVGDRLQFEVRVNPTVKHQRSEEQDKTVAKRDDVVMHAKTTIAERLGFNGWTDVPKQHRPGQYELIHEACWGWLHKRQEAAGFELEKDGFAANGYLQHQFSRTNKPDSPTGVQFSTVDLSGELVVSDVERFSKVLSHGLGSAKAFGCGLLMVRRPVF